MILCASLAIVLLSANPVPQDVLSDLQQANLVGYGAVADAYGVETDELRSHLAEKTPQTGTETRFVALTSLRDEQYYHWVVSVSDDYDTSRGTTSVFHRVSGGAWRLLGTVDELLEAVYVLPDRNGWILTTSVTVRGTGVAGGGPSHYLVTETEGVHEILSYWAGGYNYWTPTQPGMEFGTPTERDVRFAGDCVVFEEHLRVEYGLIDQPEGSEPLLTLSGSAVFRYDLEQKKIVANPPGISFFRTGSEGIELYDNSRFLRQHAGALARAASAADGTTRDRLKEFALLSSDAVARIAFLASLGGLPSSEQTEYPDSESLSMSATDWLREIPWRSFCHLMADGKIAGQTVSNIEVFPSVEDGVPPSLLLIRNTPVKEDARIDESSNYLLVMEEADANAIRIDPLPTADDSEAQLWVVSMPLIEDENSMPCFGRGWDENPQLRLWFSGVEDAHLTAYALATAIKLSGGKGLEPGASLGDSAGEEKTVPELDAFWKELSGIVERENAAGLRALASPEALVTYGTATGPSAIAGFTEGDEADVSRFWSSLKEAIAGGGHFVPEFGRFPLAGGPSTDRSLYARWGRMAETANATYPSIIAVGPGLRGSEDGSLLLLEIAGVTRGGVRIGRGFDGPLSIVSLCELPREADPLLGQ